jgi:predicted enzyme related to lactoylglutathione lyase
VTLAVDDLDAHERRVREAGIPFTEEAGGTAPRRLVFSDIDGNRIAFFQDPSATDG